MDIEIIPLSQLQADPLGLLSECCELGRPLVVELPDHRLVSIHPLEPDEGDDSLVSDLLERNPSFRSLVERSKSSPRMPLVQSDSVSSSLGHSDVERASDGSTAPPLAAELES